MHLQINSPNGLQIDFHIFKKSFSFKSKQQIASGGGWGERHLELCPRCCFKRSERFVVDRLYCWRELWRQSGEKASAAELLPPSRGTDRSHVCRKVLAS